MAEADQARKQPNAEKEREIQKSLEIDPDQPEKTAVRILQRLDKKAWQTLDDQWGVEDKPIAVAYLYPSSATTPDVDEIPDSYRAKAGAQETRVAPTGITSSTGYLYDLFKNLGHHIGVNNLLLTEYYAGAFATTFRLTATGLIRRAFDTHGPDNFWGDRIKTEAQKDREDGLLGLDAVHEMSLSVQHPEAQSSAVEAGRTYLAKTYQEYLRNQILLGDHPGTKKRKVLELAAKLEAKYGPPNTKDADHTHNWGRYVSHGEWVGDTDPTNNVLRIINPETATYAEVDLADFLLGEGEAPIFHPLEECRTSREAPPLVTITFQQESLLQPEFDGGQPVTSDRKRLWEKYKAQEGLRGWQLDFGIDKDNRVSEVVGDFSHDFGEAKEAKLLLNSVALTAGNEKDYSYVPEHQRRRHDIKYKVRTTLPLEDSAFGIRPGDAVAGTRLDQEVRKFLGIGSVAVQAELPPDQAKDTRDAAKLITAALLTRKVTREGEKLTIVIGETEQEKCVDFILGQTIPGQEVPSSIRQALRQVLFENALTIQSLAMASQVDNGFSLPGMPEKFKTKRTEKHVLVCVEPVHQPKVVAQGKNPTRLSLALLGDTSAFGYVQEVLTNISNQRGSGANMSDLYDTIAEAGISHATAAGVDLKNEILDRSRTFYRQVMGSKLVGGNILAVVSTLSREGGFQQFLEGLATLAGGNRLATKLAGSTRQISNVQVLRGGLSGFVSSLNSTLTDAIGANNDERSMRHRVKTADLVKAYLGYFSTADGFQNFAYLRGNTPPGLELPGRLDEKNPAVTARVIQVFNIMAARTDEVGDKARMVIQQIRNEVVAATVRETTRICETEIAYGRTVKKLFTK